MALAASAGPSGRDDAALRVDRGGGVAAHRRVRAAEVRPARSLGARRSLRTQQDPQRRQGQGDRRRRRPHTPGLLRDPLRRNRQDRLSDAQARRLVYRAGLRPRPGRHVRQREVLRDQRDFATRSPSSAPGTSSSRRAHHAGTGRSKDSSGRWTPNGRTAASGLNNPPATGPWHPSSASTTVSARTQPAAAALPSPAFTNSAGRTTSALAPPFRSSVP